MSGAGHYCPDCTAKRIPWSRYRFSRSASAIEALLDQLRAQDLHRAATRDPLRIVATKLLGHLPAVETSARDSFER